MTCFTSSNFPLRLLTNTGTKLFGSLKEGNKDIFRTSPRMYGGFPFEDGDGWVGLCGRGHKEREKKQMYVKQARGYTCESPSIYMKGIGRESKQERVWGIGSQVEVHIYHQSGV